MAGDSRTANTLHLFCLWPGDENVTSSENRAVSRLLDRTDIAAQCCASNQPAIRDACRRMATVSGDPSNSKDDCIAGVDDGVSTNAFVAMTYGQTVAKCESMGLGLCGQSCYNQGCQYNFHPVY